jgi:ABC-type glycerol-3-phosphate transport system permease component
MSSWLVAVVVEAPLFAVFTVQARRRFGAKGLGIAAVVLALMFSAFAVLAPQFATFDDVRWLPVVATVTGALASSLVTHRFISRHSIPDALVQEAFGAVTYIGGFLAGLYLTAMMLPRIG